MMVGSTRSRAYSNTIIQKRKYTKRKNTQANELNNAEANANELSNVNNSLHLELQESIQNENFLGKPKALKI